MPISKSCRNVYPININKRTSEPFYFIHTDVWYALLLFIVTVTLLLLLMHMGTSLHLVNSKDVIVRMFKTYHKTAGPCLTKNKALRLKNSGKYRSKEFQF